MAKKKRARTQRSGGYNFGKLARRYAGWAVGSGVAGAIAVVAVLVATSGGSGEDGVARATATPDPRVAGATPAAVASIETDDEGQQVNPRFVPATIEGKAGEVLEIEIRNAGTVAHNLRVSGVDREYDTGDDFASAAAKAGSEVRLLLKLDQAGSYPFRCDFHPQQTGTLVLN